MKYKIGNIKKHWFQSSAMRVAVFLVLLVAVSGALYEDDEDYVEEDHNHVFEDEEEEILVRVPRGANLNGNWYEESYDVKPRRIRFIKEDNEDVDRVERRRRNTDGPFDEHIRVKRRCDLCENELRYRSRRSSSPYRNARQTHQYEVHEVSDDFQPETVTYEELLAASADVHHKVYPGAPNPSRYMNSEVSAAPIPLAVLRPPIPNVSFSPSSFIQPIAYNKPSPFVPSSLVFESLKAPKGKPVPLIPVPVSSEPVRLPLQRLAEEDQTLAGAQHKQHHSHGHKSGGGRKHHADQHKKHGGKSSKGFSNAESEDHGKKGFKTDEHHKKEYEEAEGKKKKHHDEADHRGEHEEEAHGHRGSKFAEKKGHKKGHKTKGFHNKYHKDEYHKEHKFYDDFHKSGEHHRYGKFNAKHSSDEGGKKKAHHVDAGHDVVERGKKGHTKKGHVDSDHKGHNAKHGHDDHHHHEEHHAKKGGNQGGKKWGYQHKG